MNVAAVVLLAMWPLSAIIVSTASVLVAARNFQSAWLMRTLGEHAYSNWHVERVRETHPGLIVFCLLGQTVLTGIVGLAVVLFSGDRLVPVGVGMGMVAYAFAVTFYTMLALWRVRRRL